MKAIDFILFGVLFFGAIVAIIRFRTLDYKERIIAALLILTFPQVFVCYIFSQHNWNNIYIIQWYSLLEFFLIMLYYYKLFSRGIYKKVPLTLTLMGIAWFTITLFSNKNTSNGLSFILFEALAIIIAGCFYFIGLLLEKDINITLLPSFWVTISMLFYWTTTYTRDGLLIFYDRVSIQFLSSLEYFFISINIGFYLSLSLIILNHKKIKGVYG
ncbi:MAG: hypothetical protein EOP52_08120 [Sphingobacteriales bacterium]|nr:MAG: hypothetical protein EOP52_08120 [Sphingobacteriales bacterium]